MNDMLTRQLQIQYCLLIPLIASVLTACGAVTRDIPSTLVTENRTYLTEAAQIRSTLSVQETEVMAMSLAAETTVAQENVVNSLLLSTVRAGDPPTVQVVAQLDRSQRNVAIGTPAAGGNAEPGGTVMETYTTGEVRQSDGCGVDRQNAFPEGTFIIYAVQRVVDIPADTRIGIQWYFNGQIAFEDGLVVTTNESDLCIWFFLEPYSMGQWAVQFLSNGVPVGQRVEFTVGG